MPDKWRENIQVLIERVPYLRVNNLADETRHEELDLFHKEIYAIYKHSLDDCHL